MADLDLGVGRALQDELCSECRERLSASLKKRHLLLATTPRGYKKLVKKIRKGSCESCLQKIFSKAKEE